MIHVLYQLPILYSYCRSILFPFFHIGVGIISITPILRVTIKERFFRAFVLIFPLENTPFTIPIFFENGI